MLPENRAGNCLGQDTGDVLEGLVVGQRARRIGQQLVAAVFDRRPKAGRWDGLGVRGTGGVLKLDLAYVVDVGRQSVGQVVACEGIAERIRGQVQIPQIRIEQLVQPLLQRAGARIRRHRDDEREQVRKEQQRRDGPRFRRPRRLDRCVLRGCRHGGDSP